MNIIIDEKGKKLDEIAKNDVLKFVQDSGEMNSETILEINPQFNEIYTEYLAVFFNKGDTLFTARKEKKVYELNPSGIITNASKGRIYDTAKLTKNERWDIERQVREMCYQAADWNQ